MTHDVKLNYVEFHSTDLEGTKAFFTAAFGWSFTDYGPDYCDFQGEGLDGGFFRSEKMQVAAQGAPLLVFYSDTLEETRAIVEKAGALTQDIFDFPGGRRFHFTEPGGNELAVWTTSA